MSPLPRWVLAARETRLAATESAYGSQYLFFEQAPQTQERLERALEIALVALESLKYTTTTKLLPSASYTIGTSERLKVEVTEESYPAQEALAAIDKLGDSNG